MYEHVYISSKSDFMITQTIVQALFFRWTLSVNFFKTDHKRGGLTINESFIPLNMWFFAADVSLFQRNSGQMLVRPFQRLLYTIIEIDVINVIMSVGLLVSTSLSLSEEGCAESRHLAITTDCYLVAWVHYDQSFNAIFIARTRKKII